MQRRTTKNSLIEGREGEDNIDFMPTILSRFDMIYIIKDEHDEQKDTVRLLFELNF